MGPRKRLTFSVESDDDVQKRGGRVNRKFTFGGLIGTLVGWVTLVDWSAVPHSVETIVGAVAGAVGTIAMAIGDALHKPKRDGE